MESDTKNETKIEAGKAVFKRVHEKIRIKNPLVRKVVGITLIIIGLLALVTPLTPGAWLALIGLEMLGLHMTFTKRIHDWWEGRKNR